jgi:hypothetical protein
MASLPERLPVVGGGAKVTSHAEVWRDGTIRRAEALGGTRGREPLQAPFALAGGVVGGVGTVSPGAVLSVVYTRPSLALSRPLALQLVGPEPPRAVPASLTRLAEALLGGLRITSALPQDGADRPLLLHRPPERLASPLDRQDHLSQGPWVTGLGRSAPQVMRRLWPNLAAPLPKRFTGHSEATGTQELFHAPVPEADPAIPPDSVADNLPGEAMMRVRVHWRCGVHQASRPHRAKPG